MPPDIADSGAPGFGVYVHWPFCAAKCPYCDFNSHVRAGGVDEADFLSAYRRELDYLANLVPNRRVRSIFIGGGTPSLMSEQAVGNLLDHIADRWALDQNAEITIEANPSSVEASRFNGYWSAGVNRVSLGVQALNDADLKRLGRLHDVDDAINALEIANKFFGRVSFDMIYARPEQTLPSWRLELKQALELASSHISLYQLTIEPGTPFAELHKRGRLQLPDQDLSTAFYEETLEFCADAGLPAYEISNHAKMGCECQHNLLYWRYGEYAGVGPGAHGRLLSDNRRIATATLLNPETWMAQVKQIGHGFSECHELGREEQALEMLLMGFRMEEGLCRPRFVQQTGYDLAESCLSNLINQELLRLSPCGQFVQATRQGQILLDSVVAQLAGSLIKSGEAISDPEHRQSIGNC